jgi:recombination protein RecA
MIADTAQLAAIADKLGEKSPGCIGMASGKGSRTPTIPGVVPTGIPTLDVALGRGGWPLARLSVASGEEGTGKTTLALLACASVQRAGGVAMYQDKEHKLDMDWARFLGVNTDELLISQPPHLEDCLEMEASYLEYMNKNAPGLPGICILDSINSAVSKEEMEGKWDSHHIGAQARVFSELLKRIVPLLGRSHVSLLWISQPRTKVNTFGPSSKELVAGGKAPKFYGAVVVELIRTGWLMEGGGEGDGDRGRRVGTKMLAKVVKNQVAPPYKEGIYQHRFGEVPDYHTALLDRAIQLGLADKDGSWYTISTEGFLSAEQHKKLPTIRFQGASQFRNRVITKTPEVLDFLERKHREPFGF